MLAIEDARLPNIADTQMIIELEDLAGNVSSTVSTSLLLKRYYRLPTVGKPVHGYSLG